MPVPEDNNANIREHLLSINELNRPKIVDMTIIKNGTINSAVVLIARMILMRKGTIPDSPDMGIDIRSRYRFSYDNELLMLQEEIEQQITTYLPEFLPIETKVFMESSDINKIVIRIVIDGVAYDIIYNTTTNTIDTLMER